MKKLSARRRHPLAAIVVLIFALAATGGLYAAFAPAGEAQAGETAAAQSLAIEEGKKLYAVGCSSCHGTGGQGTSDGPSLVGVGAAAVDFQVGTGRMPMQAPGAQAPKKPVMYSQAEIDQMAAYIASLGPGPAIPTEEQYGTEGVSDEEMAEGGVLFRTNCAQCHNFTGEGGALTRGKYAPDLTDVSAKHIYEAMQTGPQNMPAFPDTVLPEEEKRAITAYLQQVNSSEANTPGGFKLGGYGPVAEGLFAWVIGLPILVGVTVWIAARNAKAKKS